MNFEIGKQEEATGVSGIRNWLRQGREEAWGRFLKLSLLFDGGLFSENGVGTAI